MGGVVAPTAHADGVLTRLGAVDLLITLDMVDEGRSAQ